MVRVIHFHKNKVGYINYVVDTSKPNRFYSFLKPFWTFLYSHIFQNSCYISSGKITVFYAYFYIVWCFFWNFTFYFSFRIFQFFTVVCWKLPCNTYMWKAVRPVWSYFQFKYSIVYSKIILKWHTYRCIFRKDYNSILVTSYSQFIFRTKHTARFFSSYFTFFYNKIFTQPCPYLC